MDKKRERARAISVAELQADFDDYRTQILEEISQWKDLCDTLNTEIYGLKSSVHDIGMELSVLMTQFDEFKRTASFKPKGVRPMTLEDARRVVLGDMSKMPPKEVAILMGLSYGQVYSARNGYTFKEVYEEWVRNDRRKKDQDALDRAEQEQRRIG